MRLVPEEIDVVKPPSGEPITWAQCLEHGRLAPGADQQLVEKTYIPAARERCEGWTRRAMLPQDISAIYRRRDRHGCCCLFNGSPVELRLLRGVRSVLSVENEEGDALEASSYKLIGSSLFVTGFSGDFLTVTYTAGFESKEVVPQDLIAGMLSYVSVIYDDRLATRDGSRYEATARPLPMGVEDLWRKWRIGLH